MSRSRDKIFTEHPRTRARLILFSFLVLIGFSMISVKIAFLASKENKENIRYTETEGIHSRLNISDSPSRVLGTMEFPQVDLGI